MKRKVYKGRDGNGIGKLAVIRFQCSIAVCRGEQLGLRLCSVVFKWKGRMKVCNANASMIN